MRTIIEFLPDESGDEQALSLIHDIRSKIDSDEDMKQLFIFIMRGLEFLEGHGLGALNEYFIDETEDGFPYTIRLVKELRNHVPLLEFRVNWKNAGAFRCVFFEHRVGDLQVLLMIKAVLKQATYSPEFEKIALESESIYKDFVKNPEKYINFQGVDQYE
ncbi:hypothetical protein [Paenibacillus lemnae]|uniref:Uncharacterized protein n=1 Tax=Paenibacillus lemnae TaxID=1330551 RepID=A0A848MFD8_PAELE|nr:hypothetical protein [Paenibacillus lemnae]NMO98134.1 hypothetical protein [Paenibacillus lemnae]